MGSFDENHDLKKVVTRECTSADNTVYEHKLTNKMSDNKKNRERENSSK